MSSRASFLVRLGFVGAAVAASTTLAAPAHAADNLPYNCDFVIGEATGSFAATANLTSNTDGRSLPPDSWEHRVWGSVTLPEEFVDVLRTTGSAGMSVGPVRLHTTITGLDGDYPVSIFVDDVIFPEEGSVTLGGEGEGRQILVHEPGTYVVTAGALEFRTGLGPLPDQVACSPSDDADLTIGTFTAAGATSPSPTSSATTSAERPKVVQTDFSDEGPDTTLPVLVCGVLLVAAGGAAASLRSRADAGSRRH